MWIVQVQQANEWLPEQKFATVDQVAGYMFHTAHLFVPDFEDVLAKGGNPDVHFRVKVVPDSVTK